jgi:MoxR-like ATPase
MVIATQNPIEHEGTYPLPEAQLDRFMTRVTLGYPSRSKELEMLDAHGTHSVFEDIDPVVGGEEVVAMVRQAATVHVAPELKGYLVDLTEATRMDPDLLLGASPRATLFLQRAARVRAAANGRGYATPDDVKALIAPTLSHRVILRPEAQMRAASVTEVLARITATVPVPGTADIR